MAFRNDITTILGGITGLQGYAYRNWTSNIPTLPRLAYYFGSERLTGQDGHNSLRYIDVTLELYYAGSKNYTLEDAIETAFNKWEITKNEQYVEDQQIYYVEYNFTVVERI